MLTYLLLALDFNWLKYHDEDKSNLFHCLVKYRKVGTMIQLLKVLSGIEVPILKNKYLKVLSQ